MDSHQAREILRLYRPGTNDAADPQMAEALAVVQQDPALAEWFANHCAVYTAIRGKLKRIELPGDLKRRILLDHAERSKIIPLYSPLRLLAAAAVVMLLAAGAWQWLAPHRDPFSAYRDHMARLVQRGGYVMDMTSTNLNEIRGFLRGKQADADYALTSELEKVPGKGCAAVEWHTKKASMICFKNKDQDLYLFVGHRTDWANPPKSTKPAEFASVAHLLTASWTVGDRVYVLVGPNDPSQLKSYLQ